MRRLVALLVALGVLGAGTTVAAVALLGGEPPAQRPTPKIVPDKPEVTVKRVAPPSGPAPTLDFFGLAVGSANEAEADAWLAAHGVVGCASAENPKRITRRWDCREGLTDVVFPDRPASARVHHLFLARRDDGPVHYASVVRRYSIPEKAVEDYAGVVSALRTRLGEPPVAETGPEGTPSMMFRRRTAWSFDELEVTVVIQRMLSNETTVAETWSKPGAEPAPARVVSPFAGKPNPHLLVDSPTGSLGGE